MPYAAPRIAAVPAQRGDPRVRVAAAVLVAAVVALVGYALVVGLASTWVRAADNGLSVLNLLPPPPPPPPEPPHEQPKHARREGAASPPNLRSKATPVVAPTPIVPPLVPPPPVVAAPIPAQGNQASSGAADVPGPGTGAGGVGNGTGSGGEGDGDGDGGDGEGVRQISRNLKPSDVPCFQHGDCAGGVVYMRFTVGVNGRVTRCVVTRSSGDAELDRETCDAAQAHLRYRPATDRNGRPIASDGDADQSWGAHRRAEDDGDEG